MTDPLARAFAEHFAQAARKAQAHGEHRIARCLADLAMDCLAVESALGRRDHAGGFSPAGGGPVAASTVLSRPAPEIAP